MCSVSAGDIQLYGSCSLLGFSIFQPGFLGVVGVCLGLGIGFCMAWLVLPAYGGVGLWKPALG